MIINTSLSPLPFYEDPTEWGHLKPEAYGQRFPLIVDGQMLMPFQFLVSEDCTVSAVYLQMNQGVSDKPKAVNITDSIVANGLSVKQQSAGCYCIRYPGSAPIAGTTIEGYAYIEMLLSVKSSGTIVAVVSEQFVMAKDVNRYVKLEYGNSYNLKLQKGEVDFSDGFQFRCYLDACIGKPNYEFEESATERMGYDFIESQISKKVHRFTFLAPEYLCDALRIVRMCDYKYLEFRGRGYDAVVFSMQPKWETQGDLASVECEFETDTIVANIGGYASEAYWGHFNDDYNEDYDKGG